jgi:DNA-binding HxlR family transcriptional regulator
VAPRAYGQFCGLARAVELVGERWALLIIRDLLVGPRRFTDLRRGLPRIPTNVLAARLKELELAGIARRRPLPRPGRGVTYELTEHGMQLEEIILRLARWGASSLGEPRAGEIVTTDSMILALRATFEPSAARGFSAAYEVRVGDVAIHACVRNGRLEVADGRLPEPDLVIEAGPGIRALMAGQLSPDEALASGAVRINGDRALLDRFIEIFPIEPRRLAV